MNSCQSHCNHVARSRQLLWQGNFTNICKNSYTINQRERTNCYLTDATHQPALRHTHKHFDHSECWSVFTVHTQRHTHSYFESSKTINEGEKTGGSRRCRLCYIEWKETLDGTEARSNLQRERGHSIHKLLEMSHCFCGTTRCQSSIYKLVILNPSCSLRPSYLHSIFPLQSVTKPDVGACSPPSENSIEWRQCKADDAPVGTWPWPPSLSFCREPLDSQILLLEKREEIFNHHKSPVFIILYYLLSHLRLPWLCIYGLISVLHLNN